MGFNKLKEIILIVFSIVFMQCHNTIDDKAELMRWMANKNNGLIKQHSGNGFLLTLKYLPPEYLAINEVDSDGGNSTKSYSEYLNNFKYSRTFLLTIAHDNTKVDITNYNVFSMPEYKQRIEELNFKIKDYIYLKTEKGKKYAPVLSTMENIYEIGNRKSIYLVFSDDKERILSTETLDVVFQDEFIDTGISHFVFKKKNIDNLPVLTFLN